MSILVLNNEKLYYSFLSGANEVIAQKNNLNAINVFPVPDGDTGSNLASMMQTILDKSSLTDNYNDTLMSISDAALIGARGNSGIIFAQYINGLLEALEENETIDIEFFSKSLTAAVPYAYNAINNPVEGTMITLMREFAEIIAVIKLKTKDFIALLTEAQEHLKLALSKTTKTLKVLADANVVDAGAKGFYHFIEGFINYIKTGKYTAQEKSDADIAISHMAHVEDHDETHRYCTEALISGNNLDREVIRKAMSKYGDSLVVAGNARKTRVHIHTNSPQHVFYDLSKFGFIQEQKVDDMKKQYETAHNRKYSIALVTDSIADLPQEFVDNEQIHVVPINLMIEDSNYYDKLTITSDRFYAFMDKLEKYPTSAQPNQRAVENLYSYLSTYYNEILTINVSAKMSGTYSVFEKAAEKFKDTDVKITVINSKQNSGAQGLLVMRAQEMIKDNQPLDVITKEIESLIEKTKILVSVQTLKYMVRSGRVKKTVGIVGKITNLKPVISIDKEGEGIIFDKAFSIKGSTRKITKHVRQIVEEKGIERYAIVHANAPKRVEAYEKLFTDLIGKKPDYTMDISTVVAMSAGIGTVAIAYISK
ncbi:MAG: DAK2 domain-containing protein [Candidatus Izemoplasmataceae bacterium]